MLFLNAIWSKATQAPNQWRHKVKDYFRQTAQLQAGKTRQSDGTLRYHTWATLEALYAYAMWVDTDFYMVVVAAFTELTKGNTLQPQQTIKLKLQL